MDHFGQEEYRELIQVHQGPAVSIFVPSDRRDNKGKNNQLAFRAQVQEAKKLLAERYPDAEFRPISQMMDARLNDTSFWGSLNKGVAAFFAPDMERVYRLDTEVTGETVVSDSFHTRPMLRALLHPQHYWVLVLDPKQTKLFEVSGRQIAQIHMGEIPTNVEGALALPYPPLQQAQNRETAATGQTNSVHGVGPGRDVRPNLLRQYSQILDAGLRELLQHNDDPVILCGLEQISAQFRQVSRLPHLSEEGLTESLVHLRPAEILEKTRPIARRIAEKKTDEVLALWERKYGQGQGEVDLQQIARRTLMSQVRFLFIEQGRRIWGSLDRDAGTISVNGANGDARQQADDGQADILDELAEFVISRGGQAFVLPPERMPSDTGAAAILRGSGTATADAEPRTE